MIRPIALLILILAAIGCDSSAPPSTAAESTPTETATASLRVEGMTCASCATAITVATEMVPGVLSANVSYETGTADLSYDPARTNPQAIAQVITELGYPTALADTPTTTAAAPPAEVVPGIDPEMAAICQAGCAAQEDYAPADVVAQPGAHVGDLTRCPVSGVVFRVREDQPSFVRDGQTYFSCCASCMQRLTATPVRFLGGT